MISQAAPTVTTETLLHTVLDGNLYVAAIHCCNTSDKVAEISVAFTPYNVTDPTNSWVAFKVKVRPSETFSMGGGELPEGASVYVVTSEIGVVFTLTGQEV